MANGYWGEKNGFIPFHSMYAVRSGKNEQPFYLDDKQNRASSLNLSATGTPVLLPTPKQA